MSCGPGPAEDRVGSCDRDAERKARLLAAAERTLRESWRSGIRSDGVEYGYSCPSLSRYRHQWYWDSCFHAIVWRRFDIVCAREELRTLVCAMHPDGLVPHTIFWHHPPVWRRAPFYATPSWRRCHDTAHTQTPILALAWELVADVSVDEPGFRGEALDRLCDHYDWLARERDPAGEGLLSIFLPDESGLDDAPKYDQVWRWMAHYRPGYFWAVERSRRLGYSFARIQEHYSEHVQDVLFNVLYALSLRALCRLLGNDSRAGRFERRAEGCEAALIDRCHDPETGLFFDLAYGTGEQLRVSTWSSLAPLALPALPESLARRLVEEHLLNPRRYRASVGIPSVSMEEPSFRAGLHLWRCWRGPAWMNTAWLLLPGMRRHGYYADADRIVDSLAFAVEREGFREYYDPITGAGKAATGFGWSTLLVELL